MTPKISCSIFPLLLILAPCSIQANLLFNGSFESNSGGGCVPSSYVTLSIGSTCLPGWSIVSGNVDYISSGLWDAEDGNYSIDLGGTVNGGIAQSFATTAGQAYEVTFWLAGNYANIPTIKDLEVSADSQSEDYTFDTAGKSARNMGYVQETFDFVATGSSATLEFLNIDTPSSDAGPVIDNITASAITPEPSSFALVGFALLGAGLSSTLRRK